MPEPDASLLDQLPKDHCRLGWPWTVETNPQLYRLKGEWPKITIVTPSLNQGKFLEETIRSVLLQNYPNLEYFIVDGGSTDNSVDIIKNYEPWLAYWVSQKDNGQSDAINHGLRRATGRWLSWLNSDDIFTKESLWNTFKNPDTKSASVIITSGVMTDEQLNYSYFKPAKPLAFYDLLKWGQVPNQPSVFFSKDLIKEIDYLKEDYHYTMDHRLWLDISSRVPVADQILLRDHVTSLSRIWDGIKTKSGTFSKGYSEVFQSYMDYVTNGRIVKSRKYEKCIFNKRRVFISSFREKLVFAFQGFFKFGDLRYLLRLIQ